jgi:HD-GYP domain-containing protein (c-di-GMP phosphodiesterase class II)
MKPGTQSSEGTKGNRNSQGVHRMVAKRLILAWIVLSLAVGGAYAYFEMRRVDQLAIDLAMSASESLRWHLAEVGATHTASLKAALEPLLDENYVHAGVADTQGNVVAEVWSAQQGTWLSRLQEMQTSHKAITNAVQDTLWLARELVVQVVVPLEDGSGKSMGAFFGDYKVDAKARQMVTTQMVRNISVVLLSILITALALYPVIVSLNRGVIALSQDLIRSNIELMEVLGSAIAKRDSDTDLHNFRVCLYSIHFSESLGLAEQEIRSVIMGAFLHDVGKIGISDNILLKPAKLTDAEFSVMKTHVQLGKEIVAESSALGSAGDIIEFHHEHFDGSGYQTGLKGEQIPLAARLFAIVDVFDALTSHRPYKKPFALDDVKRILSQESGTHFDPRLLDIFEKISTDLYVEVSALTDSDLKDRLRGRVNQYFLNAKV